MIMTEQESEINDGSNTPETEEEWFSLIRPEIDVAAEEADESDVVPVAKRHAEQVIERTEMHVDLDRITWQASWELKTKHGHYHSNQIKLSLHSIETNGWQKIMQTVRHELIHSWQSQHCRWDPAQPTKHARAHGPSFERWMPVLNVSKRGGYVLGKWTIECPSCDTVIETNTKRRKNQIARFIHNTESVTCQNCETDVSEYLVKWQGEQVDVESLPEIPVPSDRQNSVALAGWNDEQAVPINPEQASETRSLTDLTGVGDSIAVALGDDIHVVEDLIAQDGVLADDISDAVSTEYHDALRDDVTEWYSAALFHRGEDDPEQFDQVVSKLKGEQSQSNEHGDSGDEIKALCRTLRTAVEPGENLELTFEGSEDCTVQVKEKYIANPTILDVSVQTSVTDTGSDVRIDVPAPSKIDFPRFKYNRGADGKLAGGTLYSTVEEKIVGIERRR